MTNTGSKTNKYQPITLGVAHVDMPRIAIFASGSGTNAENIAHYFKDKPIKVQLIVTDNPSAGVIDRAKRLGIECLQVERREIASGSEVARALLARGITCVVLAGFLGRVGKDILAAYPKMVLNIHPALLPKYGGKGMYGDNVHEAVLRNRETASGITIHLVNEAYDEGPLLCQVSCPVAVGCDTVDTLSQRIHRLEYFYYPRVIEEYLERDF